jgi:hypothetical protein
MAFNGSGTFNRLYNWVTDKANSIVITASRFDDEMDGMATGLSTCITKDGQTTLTANIPFNSKKITGLGNGSDRTDSIALGQVQDNTYEYLGENGGAADAYTWSPSPAITAYTAGQKWIVKIGTGDGNTGASTANISALGTRTIDKSDGAGSTTALESGDMIAGGIYELIDNGSTLTLQNPELPYLDGTNFLNVTAPGTLLSVQTFTSSGTWNKPTGVNQVVVEVQGGGGGGAGRSGAGGTGGTSSFGAFCSATGGAGGTSTTTGGAGGVGSNGDINLTGSSGQGGGNPGGGEWTSGGSGGSSMFMGAGSGGIAATDGTGTSGTNGGGGGGASSSGGDGYSGGGAGGYAKEFITSGLGSSETITIGAAGSAGSAGGGAGGAGTIIVWEYS